VLKNYLVRYYEMADLTIFHILYIIGSVLFAVGFSSVLGGANVLGFLLVAAGVITLVSGGIVHLNDRKKKNQV
jgi:hypothetical protein